MYEACLPHCNIPPRTPSVASVHHVLEFYKALRRVVPSESCHIPGCEGLRGRTSLLMAPSTPYCLLRPISCFLIAPTLQTASSSGTSAFRFLGMQNSCFIYYSTAVSAARVVCCRHVSFPAAVGWTQSVLTKDLQGLSDKIKVGLEAPVAR